MKFLLFGVNIETVKSVFNNEILEYGIYKKYNDIITEGVVYRNVEYAFGTWDVPSFSEQELKKYFPDLKVLFYGAGSIQYFAKPFFNAGIRIFSAWAANAIPVAEYSVAQIILANKGFFKYENLYRKYGKSKAKEIESKYPGNYKTKVGILGAGMIGKKVIEKLSFYDLDLLVFDPFLSDKDAFSLGVKKASLDKIFSECQTITNHLAKNKETNGLLSYKYFSKMNDYSTFINTARGSIVNEEDLKKAMRENDTLLSIIDVLDPSEERSNEDDIFSIDNIIITPHSAGSQCKELKRMGSYMIEQYYNIVNNKKTEYEVFDSDLITMA